MTKRFLQALHFQQSFITSYFFFAFVASIFVAAPKFITLGSSEFLLNYPMTCWLVAFNFLSFSTISYAINYLPFSKYYPVVLYGQTLLYFGVAYEYQDTSAAFLGVLPALTGIISLSRLWAIGEKEGEHRYQTYLYLLALSYGWFHVSSSSFIAGQNAATSYFLPIFFGQILAMTLFPTFVSYFAHPALGSMNFPMFFKKLLENESYTDFEKQDKKDRFFFHDMINHLYGISLKLTYRMSKGRGIESHEVSDMLGEVMALQSLMGDHFGYGHKNFVNPIDTITFFDLKPFIYAQINSFVGDKSNVDIIYSGVFDENQSNAFPRPNLPFAAFYRIFTNLLKNAREANCQNIEVIFEGSHDQLMVTMRNDFKHVSSNEFEMGEGLSKAIKSHSDMQVDYKGLGLAAIESLCHEHGGDFSFEIRDGLWVSYFRINYTMPIASKLEYERWFNSNLSKLQDKKVA